MHIACAALVGLVAGWFAPVVVQQWIDADHRRFNLPGAVVCAPLFAIAAMIPAGDAFAALAYWCVCLTLVDYSCCRLPNALTGPGTVAVLTAAAWDGLGLAAFNGGVLLALLYAVVHVVSRGGVGGGDVKLAIPLGAAAATSGGSAWWWAAACAPMGTAALGLALRRVRGAVPHGPSMCAATLVAWAAIGT
ncbi:MAG: prepilin peptidase [Rhodococcus sp. (in: high G+C Gram-positive bacteria)]